jgi:hypothetical protein
VLRRRVFVVLSLAVIPVLLPRFAAAQAPLQPVAKLTMPASVQGRFDHLGRRWVTASGDPVGS